MLGHVLKILRILWRLGKNNLPLQLEIILIKLMFINVRLKVYKVLLAAFALKLSN